MSAIQRLWPDSTIVCIASGPSLTDADVAAVHGKARVIVINRSVEKAPWADVLYCADAWMWNWLKGAPQFTGLKFGAEKVHAKYGVTHLKATGEFGLESDPSGLRRGGNSGYQAINVAVHLGARRILLLGYDMQKGPKNEKHWHGAHDRNTADRYDVWVKAFTTRETRPERPSMVESLAQLGVEVVNCSRQTALTCFPRMTIEQALAAREVAA